MIAELEESQVFASVVDFILQALSVFTVAFIEGCGNSEFMLSNKSVLPTYERNQ